MLILKANVADKKKQSFFKITKSVNYRVQEKIFRPLFGFYDDLAQACAK
jgi:hypothetical protein